MPTNYLPATLNKPVSELNRPHRPRWMLVDDDVLNVALTGRLLRHYCDAEVECFHDSREALAAFATAPESYDFIVTDLEMPGMDGLELCNRLRTISPLVKVILATASSDITYQGAVQAGFCGMLRKPFHISALLNALAGPGHAGPPGRTQAECRCSR